MGGGGGGGQGWGKRGDAYSRLEFIVLQGLKAHSRIRDNFWQLKDF